MRALAASHANKPSFPTFKRTSTFSYTNTLEVTITARFLANHIVSNIGTLVKCINWPQFH